MISVVITNYNGAHLLKKNLPKIISLLEKSKLAVPTSRQEYEVIIVDDASTDDSIKIIESLQSTDYRLRLVKKDKNEGFASAADVGIRAAKGEYIFTLKTDTVPEKPDYFQLLLNHFKNNPKLFAVSATLKTIENGKEELRGCGQIYFDKGFFLHRRSTTNSELLTLNSSWPDGSASVFNKEIYLKIGGFDHLYNPFYWEDVDLGYRAWKAGYTIEFEPQAMLIHDFEKGAINSHYTKEQQKEVSLRNQFIFVWKNADLKHLAKFFFWETYHHAVALKNGQFNWIKIYWQAFIKWPQILQRRLEQKKINKFSDDQILRIVG